MPLEHSHVQLEGTIDLSATGVHGNSWCPAQPGRITEVGLTFTSAISANGAVQFKYRPTAGSTTGEVVIATLTITAAQHGQGTQLARDLNTLRHRYTPGSEIIVEVTDLTAASETAKAYLWHSVDAWEHADNIANKVLTA